MYVIKAIIINFLANFGFVRKIFSRHHNTGINDNPELASQAFKLYTSMAPVTGKSILELGPGQTLKVLEIAIEQGAHSAAAADITAYFSREQAKARGIDFQVYDGSILPFEKESMDLIWGYYMMQHVRHPELTVKEISRVLKPGGSFVCRLDLRDHYFHHEKHNWYHCLKYSETLWNAMTINRGSYVNRLRLSDWQTLFEKNGFTTMKLTPHQDKEALILNRPHSYLISYTDEDLLTYRFDALFTKPE
jgi:SAM-dependent methyltransferase